MLKNLVLNILIYIVLEKQDVKVLLFKTNPFQKILLVRISNFTSSFRLKNTF